MKGLTKDIIRFFHNQSFVIVSTVNGDGNLHASCKGIVEIDPKGKIYLLDLYRQKTYENLQNNSQISVTAVNEHKFRGFCLKGQAKIISAGGLKSNLIKAWEKRITRRITQRVIKNIRGEKGHPHHPEALLPKPEYLIEMEVEGIIDLTPHALKEEQLAKNR